MEFLKMLVQSPGLIFGPLMMLAGLIAVAMCVRATLRSDRPTARRALVWSLSSTALGVVGAIFGAIVWALSVQVAPNSTEVWMRLGCTILFGVFITILPAIWSLALLRRRPMAFA